MTPCRRRFTRSLLAAPAFAVAPWAATVSPLARAAVPAAPAPAAAPQVLSFSHLHTGERLEVEYARDGAWLPDALSAINHLLRDFRTGDVAAIDTGLLDILHRVRVATGSRRPFEIISAYRSPKTNDMLREKGGGGVARTSLHLSGRAVDIRLADVGLADLRDAAWALGAGGVGYYPGSNFVHVDTGRVRRW